MRPFFSSERSTTPRATFSNSAEYHDNGAGIRRDRYRRQYAERGMAKRSLSACVRFAHAARYRGAKDRDDRAEPLFVRSICLECSQRGERMRERGEGSWL